MSPKDMTGMIYKGEHHTKEARMSADQELASRAKGRPVCPETNRECARNIPCSYKQNTWMGKTTCAEWALKQREAGKREIENAKKHSSQNRS